MLKQNDPLSEARKVVEKIKKDKAAEENKPMVNDKNPNAITTVEVQGIAVPSSVADFFKKRASVGTENLAGDSVPQLKIVGGNTDLPEGVTAAKGDFYYTPTQEVFKSLDVVITDISRGYYAKGLDQPGKPAKAVFTQLVAGIILEGMKPFVMYLSGLKLQPMWDFGKEIKPFTKSKTSPIPMFAIPVTITTVIVDSNFGKKHTLKLTINKISSFANGVQVRFISDMDTLAIIDKNIENMSEMLTSIVTNSEVDRNTLQPLVRKLEESKSVDSMEAEEAMNAITDADPDSIISEPSADSEVADDMPF